MDRQDAIRYLNGISYITKYEIEDPENFDIKELVDIETVLSNPEQEFYVHWEGAEEEGTEAIDAEDIEKLIAQHIFVSHFESCMEGERL